MACLIAGASYLVSAICERLLGSCLNEVDRGASFLLNLVGTEIWNHIIRRRNAVIPIAARTTSIVGGEETLMAIRAYLTEDRVDVVGIYGMGGVGKTALLNEIHKDLFLKGPGKFDIVIYATVSSAVDVLKIQREIQSRLGLQSSGQDNPDLLRRTLFQALCKKRFLLLLDDVWGEMNLEQLGIPLPDDRNKCKVVITTRSEDVYDQLVGTWCDRRQRARKVKVTPLDEVRSWELFCQKVDADVDLDDPSIQPEAKKLVHRCGGLPLALVTVGRAMASARRPELWSRAVAQLEEYSAYRIQGMPAVHANLQFSVDRLESQTLRSCFLYCALFPEDQSIPEEQLIDYWTGEGYLDGAGEESSRSDGQDLCHARAEGYFVIEKLKSACLLEGSTCRDFRDEEKWVDAVRMHDLLRETALRLARMDPNRFLVHAGHRRAKLGRSTEDTSRTSAAARINGVDRWDEATKISFIRSTLEDAELPEMPRCARLSTLLLNEVELPRELPDGFFAAMPALLVLDLSKACVVTSHSWGWAKRFQTSICLLTELRYLNLSRIVMPRLPMELGNLRKLRHLDLSHTSLVKIPHQSISRLSALQVLNMNRSNYRWSWEWNEGSDGDDDDGEEKGVDERALSLKDLQNLDRLEELSLDLRCLDSITCGLLPSRTLLRSTSCLRLVKVCGLTADHLSEALGQMGSLRELQIRDCPHLYGELILEGSSDGLRMLGQLETLVLWRLPLSVILVRAGGGDRERRRSDGGRGSASGHRPLEKLKRLFVGGCDGLKDLRWVAHHRSLELMNVYSCRGVEGLAVAASPRPHDHGGQAASEEEQDAPGGGDILPRLTRLNLSYLPRLRSICGPGRRLPSLEYLRVQGCPQLRRIPVGRLLSGGSASVKRIDGDQKWWDRLTWEADQQSIRVTAEAAFEPIPPGHGGRFGGYDVE